ncbi:MAG: hypothetical protein KatS3mg090_0578 [Patescibacteria group bacterium]|nr:MAG: hypothetical protein KatS3mg090_0578 [Patescibacteria group bacterium]
MKKIAFFLVFCFILTSLFWLRLYSKKGSDTQKQSRVESKNKQKPLLVDKQTAPDLETDFETNEKLDEKRECVLLPYWIKPDRGEDLSQKEVFYFGIGFDSAGNILADQGLQRLEETDISVFIKPKIVVRMLDQEVSSKILSDKNLREKAVSNLKEFTTLHSGFDGFVLDLEFSPVFYDFLSDEILLFVKKLRGLADEQNLEFEIILFADNFYRQRPYNVFEISDYVDQVWIMAYDFSKKTGLPGPNFPLEGKDTYGYDLITAVSDFQANMKQPYKLGVIFGLFGYEWIVDQENRPLNQAKALTTKQISQKYVVNCSNDPNCSLKEDSKSKEKIITINNVKLSDQDNDYVYRKLLYFDDLQTVDQKKSVLKKLGVNDFCYWAYGYY